ncbi:5-formyltetrahydrofolate cyclo-ligase [Streptomonospora nanhaiensis]|uniref:5-formyltetrahydrofolate cyclo-ligase n=1 Tax=Streptomonospora nanhaiensis TaxID=1323731 RepID=A0A853BR64_9ACTN|nr:5-formyltetrahydrofolate cyclo-ligase [Streptomonospora nanhaiensis]MBV2363978.1 5-formyltetrahydrofolate cyclo-ligase [Streptomonospora nanhaiensis]NYI96981.1 5-formyltetrahydrofolate cyclo-ligase [Streptomonospora nanhaiensis]
MTDIDDAKGGVRRRVWALLDAHSAGRRGSVYGKIPDFTGADQAAHRLAGLSAWQGSRVVKSNPDRAQAEVRLNAVQDGKRVYMAVPKIAGTKPFFDLDPSQSHVIWEEAVTAEGAARYAQRVGLEGMRPIDVVVCGSVAVNREGVRLGKGAGYSDIEIALLGQAGLISAETMIVTTVHDLQVLDEPLPEAPHDVRVDAIVTPQEVVFCRPGPRRLGIAWEKMPTEKIAAIPVLRRLQEEA